MWCGSFDDELHITPIKNNDLVWRRDYLLIRIWTGIEVYVIDSWLHASLLRSLLRAHSHLTPTISAKLVWFFWPRRGARDFRLFFSESDMQPSHLRTNDPTNSHPGSRRLIPFALFNTWGRSFVKQRLIMPLPRGRVAMAQFHKLMLCL